MDLGALLFIGSVVTFAGAVDYWDRRRERRKADRFELVILEVRKLLEGPIEYRRLQESDGMTERLEAAKSQLDEIAAHFTTVGDLVAVYSNGITPFVTRVFVDDSGFVVAHASVFSKPSSKLAVRIESYGENEEWVTTQDATPPLVELPFTHRNVVPGGMTIAQQVTAHRAFAPPVDVLTRFASLDDAAKAYTRMAGMFREWRQKQSPDTLIQLDLKVALGENYDRWGAGWTQRLQESAIPKATLRASGRLRRT